MNDGLVEELAAVLDTKSAEESPFSIAADAPFAPEQRHWLDGLLTGLNSVANSGIGLAAAEAPKTPLMVLYGSQSGNCEVLSKEIRKFSASQGFAAEIAELDSVSLEDIAQANHLMIICSTFGEGEPPDNAKSFFQNLMADDAPALPASVNFSVCGLGDSSYAFFNKAAEDLFSRMVELGATPCQELMLCDVAFEDDFATWKEGVFNSDVFTSAAGEASENSTSIDEPVAKFSKNTPFVANLIEAKNLSGENSAKRVNHIEISLAGAGEDMAYEVGDALGIWPLNCPGEVKELLAVGGFSGKEIVQLKTGPARLQVLLQTQLDIHTVNAKCLETWGINTPIADAQVYDVLKQLQPELDAQTFVNGLRPLQPRLYSIASSPKKHPGEVHLTVGEVHYPLHDKARKGVASTWLGNRLAAGNNLAVYVQASEHFHITSNDAAPVIMIGPGTGIAPFRAFLEEREMRQASGNNWLFFGDQHEAEDFLYRDEIQQWQQSGLLTKTSLAWSRDTEAKIYVQTLIKAQGEEFFNWLEQGAYIYICGDASRMAADVDTAIREVIAEFGDLDSAAVNGYMEKLVAEHRYQRDVY